MEPWPGQRAEWLLTIPEAAKTARLSVRSIERRVASGEIESTLVGTRSRRIFAASLADYIARDYSPRSGHGEAA